jgi:peptidyl-prolyl cis-trans isomerase C
MKLTVFCGLFFVLGGLFLAGCNKAKGPAIATIGSHSLTESEIRDRFMMTPIAYQQYAATPEGRREFLKILIREKVLLAEAKSLGIPSDATYKAAIERYKAESKKRLADYENTLQVESALRRLRTGALAVTDADVEKYYNEHMAEFQKPIQISASHILLSTEAEAERALTRLSAKEPFERIATEMSKDPSTAARGGKLAPFQRGALVPEFEEAVLKLKVGKIAGPVKTQFGFHIIKKLGEKMLPTRSLVSAKEDIRAKLERKKFEDWVQSRQAALGVHVDEDAMSRLSLEGTQQP